MDKHLDKKETRTLDTTLQVKHDTKDMIKYTHDRLFFAFFGCAILCASALLGFSLCLRKKTAERRNVFVAVSHTIVSTFGKGFVLIAVAFKAWYLSCRAALFDCFVGQPKIGAYVHTYATIRQK